MGEKLYDEVAHDTLRTYLKEVKKQPSYNLKEIAKTAVLRIRQAVDVENALGTHKNWKRPDNLSISEIAIIIEELYHLKNIIFTDYEASNNNYLAIYIDEGNMKGLYSINPDDILSKIYSLYDNMTVKMSKDILAILRVRAESVRITRDKNYIAVNNGIFNKGTKKLYDFTPDKVFLSKSPINYNPNAKNIKIYDNHDIFDIETWMAELTDDPEITELLWQMISASIQGNHGWNKTIWLCSSSGNNGKGTLLTLMRNIIGINNISNLKVSDFSKEFYLESLITSSAVLADENDVNEYVDSSSNYKAAVTGDMILVNRKHEKAVAINYKGLIVQCINGFPKTRDKSGSFYRRLLMIPFDKCFTGSEKIYIKQDYMYRKEVLEYVLKRCLHMDFTEFVEPKKAETVIEEYKAFNDPIYQFFDEVKDELTWDFYPYSFLYDFYRAWAVRNSPASGVPSKMNFTKQIKEIIEQSFVNFYEPLDYPCPVNRTTMNLPEPIIYEYKLVNWYNTDYYGSDKNKIIDFKRKSSYRGVKKI